MRRSSRSSVPQAAIYALVSSIGTAGGVAAAFAPARHWTRSGRWPDWLSRFGFGRGRAGVARLGHIARRQHPIDLNAKVDQLAGQRVESGLQFADVAFGRDVDEVENGLDIAIEDVLVGHQSFSRTAQPLAHPLVGHQ